jgi:gluconokinase
MNTSAPQRFVAPFVLTIDVGSSSTRALLFDAEGTLLDHTVAREAHSFHTASDGTVEDDADLLIERICRCIDQSLQKAGSLADEIVAVAMDTYVSNVLGIDSDGQVVTPIYPYADTRNTEQATALQKELNEAEVLERTGCLLRSAYLPARLRWLQSEHKALYSKVDRWISVGEQLLLRLFGDTHVGYSVASWSGMLNRHSLKWDTELLDFLDLDERAFSTLVDSNKPISGLRSEFASRWPSLAKVPWYPAIGDGAAANVGSGCTIPTRLALTIGTTGALRVATPKVAQVPWGLWCYRIDGKRALLGGATSEGGNLFAWLTQTLQLGSPEQIEQALASSEADGHGLTVLPFIAGERSPGYAGNARASIVGISASTSANDIVRASLEGISYRLAIIADLLRSTVPNLETVVASGGALLSSPAWMQMLADILNQPLHASREEEATSRGVALLALEAQGVIPDLANLPLATEQIYNPDPKRHARYQAGLERQKALYTSLIN